MFKVTAEQLTNHPDFNGIEFNKDHNPELFPRDFAWYVLGNQKTCNDVENIENYTCNLVDEGVYVVSFKWNGLYSGVVIYKYYVEKI